MSRSKTLVAFIIGGILFTLALCVSVPPPENATRADALLLYAFIGGGFVTAWIISKTDK